MPSIKFMAESEGFEPSIGVNLYALSRGAPSASRPALHQSRLVYQKITIWLVIIVNLTYIWLIFFSLNAIINFFTVYCDVFGSVDTDSYLITFNTKYVYNNIVTDD